MVFVNFKQATFKMFSLNEPVWNKWVNMQYIPIKSNWKSSEPVIPIINCESLT